MEVRKYPSPFHWPGPLIFHHARNSIEYRPLLAPYKTHAVGRKDRLSFQIMVHSRLFADYGNVENSSFVLWRVTAWRMKILLSIAFLKVREGALRREDREADWVDGVDWHFLTFFALPIFFQFFWHLRASPSLPIALLPRRDTYSFRRPSELS